MIFLFYVTFYTKGLKVKRGQDGEYESVMLVRLLHSFRILIRSRTVAFGLPGSGTDIIHYASGSGFFIFFSTIMLSN